MVLVASPFWLPALPYGLGTSFRETFLDWVRPVFETVYTLREGAGNLGSGFLNLFSVQEENRILRSRLEALMAHEETHRELFRENVRLRQMLGFRSKAGWNTTPAEVIGH